MIIFVSAKLSVCSLVLPLNWLCQRSDLSQYLFQVNTAMIFSIVSAILAIIMLSIKIVWTLDSSSFHPTFEPHKALAAIANQQELVCFAVVFIVREVIVDLFVAGDCFLSAFHSMFHWLF